ncbi:hypothetical protein MRB53_036316 [Persea americana]|nr:hypothetical protein MRB53_039273 [Persea americana]KAJ8614903.1 hypothetical protein MRB53_036316 [Persea americana]|eukprot:TRINITY_DN88149_c0_g1_i1.p1 TRINITY_DN88149_c0_g1~~TRINITY_DN88149_c0_g1_i1.p1  ORF type:complete len:107 (-),score=4.44 TRINITY_DN88149_c0_g1_i1:121-441(-)
MPTPWSGINTANYSDYSIRDPRTYLCSGLATGEEATCSGSAFISATGCALASLIPAPSSDAFASHNAACSYARPWSLLLAISPWAHILSTDRPKCWLSGPTLAVRS